MEKKQKESFFTRYFGIFAGIFGVVMLLALEYFGPYEPVKTAEDIRREQCAALLSQAQQAKMDLSKLQEAGAFKGCSFGVTFG